MNRRSGLVVVLMFLGASAAGAQSGMERKAPVRVSSGVMAGRITHKVQPIYPVEPGLDVSGAVVLHAVIGEDGTIQELQVISGPVMLRDAAIEAVRQWTYRPYLLNGAATAVDTTIALSVSHGAPSADAMQGQAVQVSGGLMEAQLLTRVEPVYPPIARAAHVSGAVVLHATIGKDGMVERLEVVSGPEMLRASAMEAVRQWRYKPYLLGFQPVEVDTVITVNYRIQEPAKTLQSPQGEADPTSSAKEDNFSRGLRALRDR